MANHCSRYAIQQISSDGHLCGKRVKAIFDTRNLFSKEAVEHVGLVDVEKKIVQSMIGKGSKILSTNGLIPKGERLVAGENTLIYI